MVCSNILEKEFEIVKYFMLYNILHHISNMTYCMLLSHIVIIFIYHMIFMLMITLYYIIILYYIIQYYTMLCYTLYYTIL